jgi:hypothetical protein
VALNDAGLPGAISRPEGQWRNLKPLLRAEYMQINT